MQIAIKIIGLLIILEGILFLLKPEFLKKIAAFFIKGKRIYIAAGIRIVLGIVFLLAASHCRIFWVIMVFGLMLVSAGIGMLTIKLDKLKAMINWWQQKSELILRVVSLAVVALGIIILYSA